ncbi:MAG: 30S ribosomal protein S13 [Rickettsiales bacterium]|nr:30S ribosomal protein S13 [Rickettsiales bacterium]
MVRVAGVNIPDNKRLVIALTYVYGVGHSTASDICKKLGIQEDIRASILDDNQIVRLREILDKEYVVESERRRIVMNNIKTKMDLGSYEGIRHRRGLPVRGQRTRTNSRTRKGKAKTVANKKK